jgi:hypothetical protein
MNIIILINFRKNSIIGEELSKHNIFHKYYDLSDLIYTSNDISASLLDIYEEITCDNMRLLNKIIVFDIVDYINDMIDVFILNHVGKNNGNENEKNNEKIYLNLISDSQTLTKTKLQMISMVNEKKFKNIISRIDNDFFIKLKTKQKYLNVIKFLLRVSIDVEDLLDDLEIENLNIITRKKFNILKNRKKIQIDLLVRTRKNIKINDTIKYEFKIRKIDMNQNIDENKIIDKFKLDMKINYDLSYWNFLLEYVNKNYQNKNKFVIIISDTIETKEFDINNIIIEILESKKDILYFDYDNYCIGKCDLVYYYCLLLNYYGLYNPEKNKRDNINSILNNFNKLQIFNYYDYKCMYNPKIQLIEHMLHYQDNVNCIYKSGKKKEKVIYYSDSFNNLNNFDEIDFMKINIFVGIYEKELDRENTYFILSDDIYGENIYNLTENIKRDNDIYLFDPKRLIFSKNKLLTIILSDEIINNISKNIKNIINNSNNNIIFRLKGTETKKNTKITKFINENNILLDSGNFMTKYILDNEKHDNQINLSFDKICIYDKLDIKYIYMRNIKKLKLFLKNPNKYDYYLNNNMKIMKRHTLKSFINYLI